MNNNEKSDNLKTLRILGVDLLLLSPALIFWMSVVMYVGLGTDYVFDAVLAKVSETWWGNTLLIFSVVALPGLAIPVNGLSYMLKKRNLTLGMGMCAFGLLMLGFYAVLKRS